MKIFYKNLIEENEKLRKDNKRLSQIEDELRLRNINLCRRIENLEHYIGTKYVIENEPMYERFKITPIGIDEPFYVYWDLIDEINKYTEIERKKYGKTKRTN